MVNGQRSTVNSQRDKETKRQREEETKRGRVNGLRSIVKETKRQRDKETKGGREYLSLEGYTPAKMVMRAAVARKFQGLKENHERGM